MHRPESVTTALRRAAAAAAAAAVAAAPAAAPLYARADTRPAPDVMSALLARPLSTLEGQPLQAAQLSGRVVVVNFWASWCKPCRVELPALAQLHAEIAPRGGMVVAVSIDRERAKAERFVRQQRLSLPVVHDGVDGLAARLDLPYLPCTYVLDQTGHVAYAAGGGSAADVHALRTAVQRLLDAGPASVAGAPEGVQ